MRVTFKMAYYTQQQNLCLLTFTNYKLTAYEHAHYAKSQPHA